MSRKGKKQLEDSERRLFGSVDAFADYAAQEGMEHLEKNMPKRTEMYYIKRMLPYGFLALMAMSIIFSSAYSAYQVAVPVQVTIFRNITPVNQSFVLPPMAVGSKGSKTFPTAFILNTAGDLATINMTAVGRATMGGQTVPLTSIFARFTVTIQLSGRNITTMDALSNSPSRTMSLKSSGNTPLAAVFEWAVKPNISAPTSIQIWILA